MDVGGGESINFRRKRSDFVNWDIHRDHKKVKNPQFLDQNLKRIWVQLDPNSQFCNNSVKIGSFGVGEGRVPKIYLKQ